MKKALLLLPLLCGSIAWAGPFTSEGEGPVQVYVSCNNSQGEVAFQVRSTAVTTYAQGLYTETEGQDPVILNCKGANTNWKCDEARAGEGQLSINTEMNSQGFVIAQVFRKNILGKPQFLQSLACPQN